MFSWGLSWFDWPGDFFVIETETEGSRLYRSDHHNIVEAARIHFDTIANSELLLPEKQHRPTSKHHHAGRRDRRGDLLQNFLFRTIGHPGHRLTGNRFDAWVKVEDEEMEFMIDLMDALAT